MQLHLFTVQKNIRGNAAAYFGAWKCSVSILKTPVNFVSGLIGVALRLPDRSHRLFAAKVFDSRPCGFHSLTRLLLEVQGFARQNSSSRKIMVPEINFWSKVHHFYRTWCSPEPDSLRQIVNPNTFEKNLP